MGVPLGLPWQSLGIGHWSGPVLSTKHPLGFACISVPGGGGCGGTEGVGRVGMRAPCPLTLEGEGGRGVFQAQPAGIGKAGPLQKVAVWPASGLLMASIGFCGPAWEPKRPSRLFVF